jgi:hypothetical protein
LEREPKLSAGEYEVVVYYLGREVVIPFEVAGNDPKEKRLYQSPDGQRVLLWHNADEGRKSVLMMRRLKGDPFDELRKAGTDVLDPNTFDYPKFYNERLVTSNATIAGIEACGRDKDGLSILFRAKDCLWRVSVPDEMPAKKGPMPVPVKSVPADLKPMEEVRLPGAKEP